MFGHLPELIIVLGIALVIFGPERLPEVAAGTGKMIRELRGMMDDAMRPQDTTVPEDFSSYYYETLDRSGESVPAAEELSETDIETYEAYRARTDAETHEQGPGVE